MALTDEQKELRRKGIGGSEIAAVAGINPWSSPVDVWERKVGQVEEEVDNYQVERGTFLEEGLARWLEHRAGYEVRQVGTLRHSEHPLVIATPDGAAYGWKDENNLLAAVEIKSPGFHTAKDWEDPVTCPDGIPHYYIPQVTWECAVLGANRCDVAALIGGDLKVYTVPFNPKLFDVLVQKAEQFWVYVEKQEPPPVDGSDSSSQWLKRRFPQHNDKPLLASNGEIEEYIHSLKMVTAKIKEFEAEKKLAENHIKEYVGDAPGIQGPWGKILWKNNKDRESYDTKSLIVHLEQNHPDILKGFFRKIKGPRVFRPYWAREV